MSDKKEFVKELSNLLTMAKPHLKCELVKGRDIEPEEYGGYAPDDDYVLVTCENGCTYKINVTANSLITIATDVLCKMTYK